MGSSDKKSWQYYAAYINRKLWAFVAVLLVSLAVAISVLRYSLPYMDQQKHHLENWLLQEYGAEIKIGYISAMWKGKGPAIVLKDVSLAANQSSPIALSVDETQIELDFWNSIRAGKILSQRFNLVGMELEVDVPRIENSGDDFPIIEALQSLFLEQLQRFSVSSSEVLIRTRLDQQRIQIQQLSWLNQEDRHQGVGQMRVAELARNSASFVLDLTGSSQNFVGTFYAEAEDLDLSPWLKEFIPSEYELKRSRGNFTLWAGIHNTKVTFVQGDFSESRFAWQGQSPGSSVNANLMRGDFYAAPTELGWNWNVDNLTLVVNDQAVTSNWRGDLALDGSLRLESSEGLDIAPMLPMLGVVLGEQAASSVAAFAPELELGSLQFVTKDGEFAAKVEVDELSLRPQNQVPGIRDLAGTVYWFNDLAKIELSGRDGIVSSRKLLGYDLPFELLDLQLGLDLAEDKNELFATNISLASEQLNLTQGFSYQFDTGRLTYLGSVDALDIDRVKALFPTDLMGKYTRAYLTRALESGRVDGATILFDGVPSHFPFDDGSGIFQAGVALSDTQFSFEASWPSIEQLNANLLFENDALYLFGESGNLAGLNLKDAKGVLPELSESAVLELNALGGGTGEQVTELFQQSSLADTVGASLDVIKINGDLDAEINMQIPMTGENIVATGRVNLSQDSIAIPTIDVLLEDVTGHLLFENEKLNTETLSANLLQQPVQIEAIGRDSDNGYLADISVSGDWQVKPLLRRFHPAIEGYFNGASGWDANVNIRIPESGYYYGMQIVSQLDGVGIDLPAPAGKQPEQNMRLILDSEGDATASTVRMLVGSDIKFNGIIPHDTGQFSRAHLSIGGDNFVGMGLGFSVSADLQYLDYSPWYRFVGALIDGMPESDNPILAAPKRVYVETQSLDVAGQTFTDVEILGKHRENDWLLEIDSEQTRANAVVHKDWLNEGVQVNADFVRLGNWQQQPKEGGAEPISDRLLPPINFVCQQCEFKDYELGQVTLNMSRSATGMSIDLLEMRKRDGVLSATGNWFISGLGSSTRVKGTFNSGDFGAFLKTLDFDSGIRDSDAVMDFDLSWAASPYEFSSQSLGGHIDWRLGDGYLTEVSDKGARIFSILSLESLVRKLTLDFRDIFAKGFFYNKMEGSFQVQQGKVETNDAEIDGAAATVKLDGYTDLTNNKLNYMVSVKPNVTSSLPALLAWMVNPATAVAALALDEVLSSANVVSNLQYSLTGTLNEPIMTEIGRSSQEVELPAQNQLPVEPAAPEVDSVPIIPKNSDDVSDEAEGS